MSPLYLKKSYITHPAVEFQVQSHHPYPFHPTQFSSPEDIQRIVNTVIESTAKIIIVFSSEVELTPLISELIQQNVTNRTWIASEAWVTSALINQPEVSPRQVKGHQFRN